MKNSVRAFLFFLICGFTAYAEAFPTGKYSCVPDSGRKGPEFAVTFEITEVSFGGKKLPFVEFKNGPVTYSGLGTLRTHQGYNLPRITLGGVGITSIDIEVFSANISLQYGEPYSCQKL